MLPSACFGFEARVVVVQVPGMYGGHVLNHNGSQDRSESTTSIHKVLDDGISELELLVLAARSLGRILLCKTGESPGMPAMRPSVTDRCEYYRSSLAELGKCLRRLCLNSAIARGPKLGPDQVRAGQQSWSSLRGMYPKGESV